MLNTSILKKVNVHYPIIPVRACELDSLTALFHIDEDLKHSMPNLRLRKITETSIQTMNLELLKAYNKTLQINYSLCFQITSHSFPFTWIRILWSPFKKDTI